MKIDPENLIQFTVQADGTAFDHPETKLLLVTVSLDLNPGETPQIVNILRVPLTAKKMLERQNVFYYQFKDIPGVREAVDDFYPRSTCVN